MRERSSRPGRLYAAIPNGAMRDSSISIEARGMLALLMTYADDWVFRRDHLQEVSGLGRDKFERVMGELRAAGYVELQQMREQGSGRLLGSTWVIRDHRDPEKPGVGVTEALKNRDPAEPTPGESAPIRRTTLQEEKKERTPLPPEGDLFGDSQSSEQDEQPESQAERSGTAKKKKEDPIEVVLRSRLSKQAAVDFIAHRKALKKPLTPRAAELVIAKLDGCADPDAVVNASIMNGWQGVFPERAVPAPTAPPAYKPRERWYEVER